MLRTLRVPLLFFFSVPVFVNPFSYKKNFAANPSIISRHFVDSLSSNDSEKPVEEESIKAYDSIGLATKGLSKNTFELAMKGYNFLLKKRMITNKNIISIIDYSQRSDKKRLYVIDIKKYKLLFQTLVAHGRNSGLEYATQFSNDEESHKTSLGFYVTLSTYTGECGYALKLKGCEKGFNDKAYDRSIVMHGSEYVNDQFIHSNGFLGRSFGCPAVPEKLHKKIIDVIKKGSCLFLYHPTKKYLLTSPVLNG